MGRRSYPLILRQGRTLTKPFRRRNKETGLVIDFAEYEVMLARLQVRTEHGGDVLLDLSTDNGGIVLGLYDDGTGKQWSGYLYASAAATGALVPWGEAVYDLVVATAGNSWVKTLFSGVAILVPASTELED